MTDIKKIYAELELRRRKNAKRSLYEFIVHNTPQYTSPTHLKPLIDYLTKILKGESVRLLCSTPPRHGKTETLLHFAVRYLLGNPTRRIAYITYEAGLAESKSIIARRIADRALLEFGEKNTQSCWSTSEGGEFYSVGVGGPLTGKGYDIIIIDDPIKNAVEASSQTTRERVFDWFASVVMTRLEPNGSIIVNMARWHQDDLIGKLQRLGGWEYVNIPAIQSDGSPLWGERFTIEALNEIKKHNEFFFEALYMGNPKPAGATLFKEPSYYTDLPSNLLYSIGIDFSYTNKATSDFSVVAVLATDGTKIYVVDIFRKQLNVDEFESVLRFYKARFENKNCLGVYFYGSSIEKGLVALLNQRGHNIIHILADTNKFVRALPVANEWNAGNILIPSPQSQLGTQWASALVEEVLNFTGQNDIHDDQIDALAGAYYALQAGNNGIVGIV